MRRAVAGSAMTALVVVLAMTVPVSAAPGREPGSAATKVLQSARISTPVFVDGARAVFRDVRGHVYVANTPGDPFCVCPDDYSLQDVTLAAHTSARAASTPHGYVTVIGSVRERIVFRAKNGHVHQLWRNRGSAPWHDIDLTLAAATAARAVGDVVGWSPTGSQWQHVAYRGRDSHVHVLSWHAKTMRWKDADLTAHLSLVAHARSDPTYHSSVSKVGGKLRDGDALDYRSQDGHVHQLFHAAGHWSDLDVTAAAHTSWTSVGSPSGYFSGNSWPVVPQDSVLFRGANKHVYELRHNVSKDRWNLVDITKQTKAPLASADPSGTAVEFYDNFSPGQLVSYPDTSQHVVQVSRHTGDRQDPTPPPPNDPWSSNVKTSDVARSIDLGYDYALREAWVSPDRHVWMRSTDLSYFEANTDDLTTRLKAPKPTGAVSAYVVTTSLYP